jgi:histidinol phosphatase-like PHP family hydrolase
MKLYDLHTHSTFSDGDATLEYLVDKATEKGYRLGVSDHVYCGQIDTEAQMERYLDALDRFDVYKGIEANIGTDFTMPDRILGRLDYCIASVHFLPARDGSVLRLSEYFGWRAGHRPDYNLLYSSDDSQFFLEESLRLMEKSFSRFRVDILGHSTVTPFYMDMDGTQFQIDFENELLSLCKKYNVALEISGLWKEPSKRVIMNARERGIKFSFGSDCHKLAEVCDLEYVCKMIDETGITRDELFIPNKRSS